MFRKLNNKKLSLLFVSLFVLVIIVVLVDNKKGGRSFTENLVPVDTSKITRVEIFTGNGNEHVILDKMNGAWKLNKEGKIFETNKAKVNDILTRLAKMQPSGVVSDSRDKWPDYNVTDSAGTHVQVFEKKKKKADFIIGRFNYKPNNNNMYGGGSYNQGSFKTYVRPVKEKKVYTINEFLSMSFTTDFNSYRNNIVVKLNPDDIVKISFNYPSDSSFIIIRDNNAWKINGSIVDSMKVDTYINSFRNLSHSGFVDMKPAGMPGYTVIIEGNNMVQPVTLMAFLTENNNTVLTSMNEETFFDGNESDLFDRLFVNKSHFDNQDTE